MASLTPYHCKELDPLSERKSMEWKGFAFEESKFMYLSSFVLYPILYGSL